MTNEACVAECESRGFSYAGTQYYTECCMLTACDNTALWGLANTAIKRLRSQPTWDII